jgi:hypothetical protein
LIVFDGTTHKAYAISHIIAVNLRICEKAIFLIFPVGIARFTHFSLCGSEVATTAERLTLYVVGNDTTYTTIKLEVKAEILPGELVVYSPNPVRVGVTEKLCNRISDGAATGVVHDISLLIMYRS